MARTPKWLLSLMLPGLLAGCEGGGSTHFVGKSPMEVGYLDRLKAVNPLAVDTFPDGHLREVQLLEAKLSETALTAIGRAPRLEILLLGQSDLDDDGLRLLEGMSSLEILGVMRTRITDAGMKHIAKMTGLKVLILGHNAVTDVGLAELARMPSLEKLAMTGLEVSDAGMESLTSLENLNTIEISGTRVTERGIAALKAKFPELEVFRNFENQGEGALLEATPSE